jgi:hypothetical protein
MYRHFSVEAVATTLTEDSFQPEVDTGDDMDIANMDESVPPTSIEDEDTSGDVVSETDVTVLAEVKLPSRARKCFSYCFL